MSEKPCLTVYYDGQCPVCLREIAFYRCRAGSGEIAWVNAADCDASDLGPDMTREQALGRFHVRLPDGRTQCGAAAFVAIWRQLPAFRPLAWLFAWTPLTWALEVTYRLWLRWRSARRSMACPAQSNA